MNTLLTKTQIEVNFDVNAEIRSTLERSKKTGEEVQTKERFLGEMIERQHKLEKLLTRKNMSFEELLTLIKNQS